VYKRYKISPLRKRQDFHKIQRTGNKFVARSFILYALENKDFSYTDNNIIFRYGITASKKIGNAVIRNRAKRRVRALITDVMVNYAQKNRDYIIIARPYILSLSYAELVKEINEAIK
jgi:ribonuclease P protein component